MKKVFDLIITVTGLVLAMPVMLLTALLVWIFLGRPLFFSQTRPGLHGTPFRLLKFRTLRNAVDRDGKQLPDAQRMTRFGTLLRKTSLDELPELWNILKGDMSLVGPRPLLMEYLPLYTQEQMRRHEVRPGITGWSQVKGRNALSWEERFRLDVWYVDNHSLWLDIKILALTVLAVISASNISQQGHVTQEKFRGTDR
jgi:lipopolysaccharide/colanic/teichoic acid biosynthesis glycosyltransferase